MSVCMTFCRRTRARASDVSAEPVAIAAVSFGRDYYCRASLEATMIDYSRLLTGGVFFNTRSNERILERSVKSFDEVFFADKQAHVLSGAVDVGRELFLGGLSLAVCLLLIRDLFRALRASRAQSPPAPLP